jgi:hypothetical protein
MKSKTLRATRAELLDLIDKLLPYAEAEAELMQENGDDTSALLILLTRADAVLGEAKR